MPRVSFISDRDIEVEVTRTPNGDWYRISHLGLGFEQNSPLVEQRETSRLFMASTLRHMVNEFEELQLGESLAPDVHHALTLLRSLDGDGLREWLSDPDPQVVLAALYEYERRKLVCPVEHVYANAKAMADANVREAVGLPQ